MDRGVILCTLSCPAGSFIPGRFEKSHLANKSVLIHKLAALSSKRISFSYQVHFDMAPKQDEPDATIYALIDYEDAYVQPLILAALKTQLPAASYQLISSLSDLPSPTSRLLQFVQYEGIDFDQLVSHSSTSLANAYVIRKALIRKHYLSTTISNWTTKYPDSVLKRHVKPSVEFEVDYAEFLDDALVEAWDLKESWGRGEGKEEGEREWWILKPGMSERGQGIRLFSSEEELTGIFEEWDPASDDEEEENEDVRSDRGLPSSTCVPTREHREAESEEGKGIITSQLRHFVAQPYIHPPLLLYPPTSSSNPSDPAETHVLRKFHIRTYVLATGALKVHVYRPMLALFAAKPYAAPTSANSEEELRTHLTNTCLQDTNEREGSVGSFWQLPDDIPSQSGAAGKNGIPIVAAKSWKDDVFAQICSITGRVFEAAARGMSIHFQPLPNAFELFGLDFMVGIEEDGSLNTWLLEVNAFPDFRQTGDELKDMVGDLFKGVVNVGIAPFFGINQVENDDMVKVLDVDLGRR